MGVHKNTFMKLIQYQNYNTVEGMKMLLDELHWYWNEGERDQRKRRSRPSSEKTKELKQLRDEAMTRWRRCRDGEEAEQKLCGEFIALDEAYKASRHENRREDA